MNILDLFKKLNEKPIDNGHLVAFLSFIKMKQRRIAYSFALYSGLGINEVLALRWEDIDYAAQSVSIYDAKKKTARLVYVPKCLIELLKEYRKENGLKGYIVQSTKYLLEKGLEDDSKEYFGDVKSWHTLRLSHIISAQASGCPIEIVSINMNVPASELVKYWQHEPSEIRMMINHIGENNGNIRINEKMA